MKFKATTEGVIIEFEGSLEEFRALVNSDQQDEQASQLQERVKQLEANLARCNEERFELQEQLAASEPIATERQVNFSGYGAADYPEVVVQLPVNDKPVLHRPSHAKPIELPNAHISSTEVFLGNRKHIVIDHYDNEYVISGDTNFFITNHKYFWLVGKMENGEITETLAHGTGNDEYELAVRVQNYERELEGQERIIFFRVLPYRLNAQ